MTGTGASSIEQVFQQAVDRHRAGQLQDAERLYRSILQSAPNHAETNHNLGMIAVQVKQPAGALRHFKAAIEADPNQGRFRLSYVYALIQSGQMDAARQALVRGLHLDLDGAAVDALTAELANHEGNEALASEEASLAALFSGGRFVEAGAIAARMTTRFPLYGTGWMALGMASAQTGKAAEAVASFQKAAALLPDEVEAHFNLCIALKDLDRLAEAEASCRRALALKPDFADAHGILGSILQTLGRHAEAEASFRAALRISPDIAQAHCNLGVSLQALGQAAEAEAAFRRALEIDPAYALAHINLGGTLKELGRVEEGEASIRRALEIAPDSTLGHCNLGVILNDLGRPEEAEASFRRALAISPDHVDALNYLGIALQAQGRAAEAEASFRRALELAADLAEAHNNLASLLIAEGDAITALNIVRQSLQIKETERARQNFVTCVRRLRFADADAELRALVLRALTEPWTRPSDLATVGINLVKLNPVVEACMPWVDGAWPPAPNAPAERLLGTDAAALAADPLLYALLNATPVCDFDLERFLTLVRRDLLEAAIASGPAEGEDDAALDFYGALANQCFINEYVFSRTDDESSKVGDLRDALRTALESGERISPLLVLAVAAYFPLGSLPLASRLLDTQWPEAVAAVLAQQIREPLEELRLRPAIARLTAIDDEISLRVQNQYEENPYPRWIKPAPAGKATNLFAFLRQKFPQAFFQRGGAAEGTDILIAGCGTGQHSIETSRMFTGARVLAVDLSMNSLGYARRKTGELGLASIEYAQADLLRLGSLERRFDLVESVGVLHHLADPWAGWRVLLPLLRPGGIMRLGFYSALARRNIVKARAFIAEKGYGSSADEIRRCRQDLLGPDTDAELRTVTTLPDFFSTSACRDLLFHVQEHRMTLTEIGAFLRANGLAFVGFEIEDEVRHAYRKRFPLDRAGVDLGQWQRFENDNPDTFIGMYQFWVQKAG